VQLEKQTDMALFERAKPQRGELKKKCEKCSSNRRVRKWESRRMGVSVFADVWRISAGSDNAQFCMNSTRGFAANS